MRAIVVDTNVLASGIVYPDSIPGKIMQAWQNNNIELIISDYILDELERVLPRLKKNTLTPKKVAHLRKSFHFKATVIEPGEIHEDELTDDNDLPVLALLVSSSADVLVTGDKALLRLSDKYPIMTASDFWNKWGM